MNLFRHRFLAWITPGAQVWVGVFLAVYLAAVLGGVAHFFDLAGWLGLMGPKLFGGQVWRLMTYAVLSPGIGPLIGNCLGVVFMGFLLEKYWSRGEFWLYGAVTAIGGGLAYVAMHASDGVALIGPGPVFFAMFIGVGFVRGRELVQLPPFTGMLTWHLVALAAGINLLLTALTSGMGAALVMVAAALTGYVYLSLRYRWLMSRDSRVVESERINRLEL